jgi:DNA invertase Pin-like site-specific DNA recombinase
MLPDDQQHMENTGSPPSPSPPPTANPTRAAEYVRMSTEHQQYSTENQSDVMRKYSESRGMAIVRTYTDAGKSGLRIDGRDALKQLIHDVENGNADFSDILVYDVSRWGRFQDADESAYYEYLCRRAKINVHYCAEQFENDGSPVSTIVKGVKRAMAGEYSRELSAKVFIGQCRLIELGFRQGGPPGFGLRRMLRDQSGQQKGSLARGEQKSIQTDRVILVPGPSEEVEAVRWVYRLFVEDGKVESEIAALLNGKGLQTDLDRPWSRGTVHQVLTNEKYIGNNVYNRVSFKLKKKRVINPPEMWLRAAGVFEPLIPSDQFYMAQGIIRERSRRYTNDELLDHLRKLLDRKGQLSGFLIDETEGMASSAVYRDRFTSLIRAYQLIGYTPDRDYKFIETNRQLRLMHPRVVEDTITRMRQLGGVVTPDPATDLLNVNGEFTASLVIARCRQTEAGSFRWLIRLDAGLRPDITVAVRMDATNEEPLDYYLLPSIGTPLGKLRLAEDNGVGLDTYRFSTLEFFFGMAARARLPEAA